MNTTTGNASKTGTCQHCGRDIRQDRKGYWGLRRTADLNANDGRPWYCTAGRDGVKRHEPAAA